MEIMTADQRNDLIWAKNAKMVRLGVYDVGILVAGVLLTAKVGELWPQYEIVAFVAAVSMWVGMILNRYADGKSIDRQEKGLTRDELEREQGVRFTKEELKDLGLD